MSIPISFGALPRLVLTFTACGAVALPAQIRGASPPPTQLAPIVVQGRDTDLVGVAASAAQGIVGAAELEARPFLRRGELLEVVPGVVVTQHSGNGKANQYFLRGFNLDHGTDFSLSVEGMPVNLRSHAHGQGYADLNFLIPEVVRQVDYNKGPFYTEVGDFSAAGAAHFRQADRFSRPFLTLSLGENRFARIVAGGSAARSSGTLTAALELSHDNGPWEVAEGARRFNGYLRRTWRTSLADYRLTAMAYHGKWTATDQLPLRAVESGALSRFGTVDDTDGGVSDRASLSFDATWRGAHATTRASAYALLYRLNLYSNFTYFLDDPDHGDQFNQRDRRTVIGGEVERTWARTAAPGARGNFTVGLQGRVDFIGELGLHRTARRARRSTVRDDTVAEASLGVFARDETTWNDWMRTTAGVRVDGYRFHVKSDNPANSGSRLADIVSPKFSAAFGPWQKTEVYANVGYGFHSNDARGTTIRLEPLDDVTPADAVTPLARSRGAEVGLRTGVLPGLVTTFSVWALDLDSELVFVGDAGGTEPTGRTRRHGIELANYYRIAPWCALDVDVSLTRARYRDDLGDGQRIPNSIASVVTAGIALGRAEGWFATTRVRYHGAQPLTGDNSVRAPSSLTYNGRVGWRARGWEVSAEVLNLFDRQNFDIAYHYASRLPGEPGEAEDLHFHPAEPLTLRLNLTRRF